MKVLVLNCGSSTLKFQLIQTGGSAVERKLARGVVDRIGGESSYKFEIIGEPPLEGKIAAENHEAATVKVIGWLSSHSDLGSVDAVGHRVVHGGDRFKSAVRIDENVIKILDSLCDLAPLHNPSSVSGIHATRKVLGAAVPMVAAFDTSFHQTIRERAAIYALPYDLTNKHHLRRYGFHGLAHQYSAMRYGELTGKKADQINIVTLHLGNGCSACAIRNGTSIDTSMGFTPLEGLVMGTRSGDLDPALVAHLARHEGIDEVENLLNTVSGLLGVSGISSDMRELIAVYKKNPRARLAIDVFCYRARKYLGAYLAALQGADAVIFSGGIGEHLPFIRKEICGGMEWCGLILDEGKNDSIVGTEGRISTVETRIQAFVIPSDEEAVIARATAILLQ
ncbi:MAG TPA: acetate kinase, partial [Candidatus Binatia bacterium]